MLAPPVFELVLELFCAVLYAENDEFDTDGSTNIRVSVFPQLCDAGTPGCAAGPAPAPPAPAPAHCEPTSGDLPPNTKEDTNLPGGDLIPGGHQLTTFNLTDCYHRCVAWNANAAHTGAKSKCEAWVSTANKESGGGTPWCWLKSHEAQKGYMPRKQKCYASAQCRVGVPASEFPCPKKG